MLPIFLARPERPVTPKFAHIFTHGRGHPNFKKNVSKLCSLAGAAVCGTCRMLPSLGAPQDMLQHSAPRRFREHLTVAFARILECVDGCYSL